MKKKPSKITPMPDAPAPVTVTPSQEAFGVLWKTVDALPDYVIALGALELCADRVRRLVALRNPLPPS